MNQMLMLVLIRALELALTGAVSVAIAFLNRNVEIVRNAELEGRELTNEEQRTITDDIRTAGAPLLDIDPNV